MVADRTAITHIHIHWDRIETNHLYHMLALLLKIRIISRNKKLKTKKGLFGLFKSILIQENKSIKQNQAHKAHLWTCSLLNLENKWKHIDLKSSYFRFLTRSNIKLARINFKSIPRLIGLDNVVCSKRIVCCWLLIRNYTLTGATQGDGNRRIVECLL